MLENRRSHLITQEIKRNTSRIKKLQSHPDFVDGLNQSVESVKDHIIDLFAKNDIETTFRFVVGGKSRQLTETLLSEVQARLPEDHRAKKAIDERIRLTDEENKNLYGTSTSLQKERANIFRKQKLPSKLTSDNNTHYIIVDDHMDSGTKAVRSLTTFLEAGLEANFIAFSQEPTPTEFFDTRLLQNKFAKRIFTAQGNYVVHKALPILSGDLSTYFDLRLNRRLDSNLPAILDELPTDVQNDFRTTYQAVSKTKELLKKSRKTNIDITYS